MTDEPIDPAALLAAVQELAAALDGVQPPCAADPEAWFEDPAAASEACHQFCPAVPECATYADLLRPEFGVWAGVDRTRRRARRRAA